MRLRALLGVAVVLSAVRLPAADRYVTGTLVEIRGGDQYHGSSVGKIPGGTITIPWTSRRYELVVQVADLMVVGATGWDKKPKGFVANDAVRVRFSRDGEKMWVVSSQGKEVKTDVVSRHRVARGAAARP